MSYLVDEQAIRQAVIDKARTQVGKHFGPGGWNTYGAWYGPGWDYALFCAAGWSWSWYMALGHAEAHRIIGHQRYGGVAPLRRGYVWTVGLLKDHEHHRVPLRQLKPGDALLFKYPTSGTRNTNVVNHVDMVEYNNPAGGYMDCIGFNVPRPGAPAGSDQSQGGGVWRRRIWYSNPYLVAGLKMPAEQVAKANRKGWTKVQRLFNDLGYGPFQGTGTPGPSTQATVDQYSKDYGYTGDRDDWVALTAHLEDTMSKIDTLITEVRALRKEQREQRAVVDVIRRLVDKAAIAAAVWQYKFDGHGIFNAWWFLRRGAVLNPEHKQFPADPGSPADIERQAAEKVLGYEVEPYVGAKE